MFVHCLCLLFYYHHTGPETLLSCACTWTNPWCEIPLPTRSSGRCWYCLSITAASLFLYLDIVLIYEMKHLVKRKTQPRIPVLTFFLVRTFESKRFFFHINTWCWEKGLCFSVSQGTFIWGHWQMQRFCNLSMSVQGLTTVRVRLAEVRRGGWLNRQLRYRHLTPHRMSSTQTAHTAAVFSVRAHLENREERREGEFQRTAALILSTVRTAKQSIFQFLSPDVIWALVYSDVLQVLL